MRALPVLSMLLTLSALTAAGSTARAEMVIGGFGVLHYRSSTTVDIPVAKYETSVTGFGLAGSAYAFGPKAGGYLRLSWAIWGGLANWGGVTTTAKSTLDRGALGPDATGGFVSDAFLWAIPRIDLGVALGPLPVKPSVGVALKDGWLRLGNSAYYAIDPGVTVGLPIGVGSKGVGVVVFPSATFFVSGYNDNAGAGSGRVLELTTAVGLGPVFAEVRLGLEHRNMPFRRFLGIQEKMDVVTDDRFLKLLIGYAPRL